MTHVRLLISGTNYYKQKNQIVFTIRDVQFGRIGRFYIAHRLLQFATFAGLSLQTHEPFWHQILGDNNQMPNA